MENKKRRTRKKTFGSRIFNVFMENETIIKRYLRRYTSSHQDIEDISQETILRALHAEKNRQIHEPRAFLFGIAKNVVRKELDRKSKSLIDFIEDFSDKGYSSNEALVDDQVSSRQQMVIFWEAVAALPSQCQKVFVLKKMYGYSHKEIAKSLEISVSTVEKHAALGLKRCSKYMENKSNGDIVTQLINVKRKND